MFLLFGLVYYVVSAIAGRLFRRKVTGDPYAARRQWEQQQQQQQRNQKRKERHRREAEMAEDADYVELPASPGTEPEAPEPEPQETFDADPIEDAEYEEIK